MSFLRDNERSKLDPTPIRIVQFVNTLAVSDGGPARNSFELNISLNADSNVRANLIWMRGSENDSVLTSHNETLPTPGPRKLALTRTPHSRRVIGLLDTLKEIRAADCVVVHGYYLPWIPLVALAAAALKTPLTLMPHGALTARQQEASRSKKKTYELLAGWLVRRTLATFVTGSKSEADEIRERFPASSSWVAGVGTRMRAPTSFRGVHSPLRLVSLSRLAPKKRIDLMIEAVSILTKKSVDCQLTVAGVGDPAFTQTLRDRAQALAVADRVHFTGQVDGQAKHKLLWDSDVFLLPSDDENFGIALAEALAHGLPSVTSSHVAASAAVKQWGGGRILTVQDALHLADEIVDLANAADFAIERRQAVEAAKRSYGWEGVAAKWITEIRRVSGTAL